MKMATVTATAKKMNKMPRNPFMREQFVILYSSQPIVSIRAPKDGWGRERAGEGEGEVRQEKRGGTTLGKRTAANVEVEKMEPFKALFHQKSMIYIIKRKRVIISILRYGIHLRDNRTVCNCYVVQL